MAIHKYDWETIPPDLMQLFSHDINMSTKINYMREAISEAKKSYKPDVQAAQCGAVIVKNNKVIGRGHRQVISPTEKGKTRVVHAEQLAIANASENVNGAELYVTLEPCYERGNQVWHEIHEPCSQLIPKTGIETVIFGLIDKDPRTNGKGLKNLVAAGVKVEYAYDGVQEQLFELIQDGKFYTIMP